MSDDANKPADPAPNAPAGDAGKQQTPRARPAPGGAERAGPGSRPGGRPADQSGAAVGPRPLGDGRGGGRGGPGGPRRGRGGPGGGGGRGPGRGGPGRGGGPGGGGGGGRGGPGGGRDRRGGRDGGREESGGYEERVVQINRCATVVKGGRRFSFSALVILGDREGQVGLGFGKANEVPQTVEKAIKEARRSFVRVERKGGTIPHKVVGEYRSSRVVLVPASEGTGVIAGASVRAVVECAGISDILTKVHGSTNPLNVVKATMNGLSKLRSREEVSRLRGVEIHA